MTARVRGASRTTAAVSAGLSADHADGWRARAACLSADPELFFPVSRLAVALVEPQRICRGCPARQECLEHALAAGERHGVWGGMSPEERHAERRRRERWAATHCPQGHEYAVVGDRVRTDGYRQCAGCARDAKQRWLARTAGGAR